MAVDTMTGRETAMGSAGVLAGGAFTGVTGMAVGWTVGFLIGMLVGISLGQPRRGFLFRR
jgi:hypothetical protein